MFITCASRTCCDGGWKFSQGGLSPDVALVELLEVPEDKELAPDDVTDVVSWEL
jgi:hypothetical protein